MTSLFCGIDLGTRASSLCVVDNQGKRISSFTGSNDAVVEYVCSLGDDILTIVESSPLAESICNRVELGGGFAEIVDSRHTKALLNGKKKTDRIDAALLAKIAQTGWYHPVHRKSGECREIRSLLASRKRVVNSATDIKNAIRGIFKAHGVVLSKGGWGSVFADKVRQHTTALPPALNSAVSQLLLSWEQLEVSRKKLDKVVSLKASDNSIVKLLMTIPGVGPITSLAFYSTIATHQRFRSKSKVSSYIGLAPRVYQSGDTEYHGRITKRGDSLLRWLLTEAAANILTRTKEDFALKEWGMRLRESKGFGKAKVAVARKLCELMYVMWKKRTPFSASHTL